MFLKKRYLLSFSSRKNYYKVDSYVTSDLVGLVYALVRQFPNHFIYFKYFIKKDLIREKFNHLQAKEFKQYSLFQLDNTMTLNNLINNWTMESIKDFNIYFFKFPINTNEITFSTLSKADCEIYAENYYDKVILCGDNGIVDQQFVQKLLVEYLQ